VIHDSSLPTEQRANKAAIKTAIKPAEKPARKLIPTSKSRTRQVRKCVEAVHITNSINLVQRKLINGLLLNAYYELPNLSISTHRIPVTQLVNLIGYDSKNIPYLRDLLKALTSTVIEWDIMNEAGKREWGVSALLASADIIDGVCTYAYSPHLRAKLFNPQFYVLLDIDIVRRFQSGYALALYENCARYRRLGQTPSFPIDVVRSLLGARDPYYDDYRKLNERVIQPALREVNAVTDLTLTIEVKREARQVTEIRFLIGSNPQQAMQIEPSIEMAGRFEPNTHPSTSSDTVAPGKGMPVIASNEDAGRGIPEPDKTTQERGRRPVELKPIPARLQKEFCLSAQVAARVCSEHPEAAIQGAMDYVLSRYNAGKVKDIGPYFLVALKEGAAIRRNQQDQDREEEARTKQTARQKLEAKRLEKAQAEMKWNQSLWARFDALPEGERQAVLEAFLTWLSTSKHKQNIVGIYQRGGLAHPWARAEFLSYLGTLNH
jgi:hypothetical protein